MNTIHHEVWINAAKETVFEAVTSREGLNAWWGKALNAEPKIDYVVEFDHGLGDIFKMRIAELPPNEHLTWRCISDYGDSRDPASEWLGHQLVFHLQFAEGQPELEWLGPRLGLDSERGEDTTSTHAGIVSPLIAYLHGAPRFHQRRWRLVADLRRGARAVRFPSSSRRR